MGVKISSELVNLLGFTRSWLKFWEHVLEGFQVLAGQETENGLGTRTAGSV